MTNLTKSLLEAISIIADKSAEEVSSDTTIKVIIKKVVSASEGKYFVNYNSGDFYVYTQPGSKDIYEVGEQIYVLVPEGDMGQKKFIIGRVQTDNDEEYLSYEALLDSSLNDYVTIGKNIVIENSYSLAGTVSEKMQPLFLNTNTGINSYYCYLRDPESVRDSLEEEQRESFNYNTIEYPSINIDEEAFSNSAKQAKALLIRANFKSLLDEYDIGNYGIIVNIAFTDKTNPQTDDEGNISYPPKLVAYVLDTTKMTGNPMKFYDYTSQYCILNFDGENYLYIDSIIAFTEGFSVKEEFEEDEEIPYICINNFEIIALDEINAINGDYKLKLTMPTGNTIKEGKKDNLKIVANMTYLNKSITKDTTFYWGMKDPSITYASQGYHAKLGAGYKYIDIQSNELELTPNDLTAAESIFVCVASYESSILLKTSVSVYNNNNNLEITIESDQGTKFQFNEGSPTLTCLINGKSDHYQQNYLDDAFTFIWSKEDSESGSIVLDKTAAQLKREKEQNLKNTENNNMIQTLSYYDTRIAQMSDISYPNGVHGAKIKCKLKNTNNYVTYSCSVYRAGIYVGYASITLQNSKSIINDNYYITITNGEQVFQYDEAGIAPNSEKKQNPIDVFDLVAVFHDPQGAEVTPKSVRWIVPQGDTLINLPLLGLLTDAGTGERYYLGDTFPLNIKDTYDNTCSDNQVIAIVTHANGTEYRQSTNLLFTKIGEIGTNGTDTVVKINKKISNIPVDECLTIIKDSDGLKYNGTQGIDSPVLEADLYVNNTQVPGYTTKWTIAGDSGTQGRNYKVTTNSDNTCTLGYNDNPLNSKLDTRIVRAQINSHGKYFYGFYGIPAIEYINDYTYEQYPIKIIQNGTLMSVLYDSNGMNPSYNANKGVQVELKDWIETGYLEWTVESGPQNNGIYDSPNLLLSRNPKSKTGSEKIGVDSDIDDLKATILNTQDTGRFCADNADLSIQKYINDFLTDIERIGTDNLLSVESKLTLLKNRIEKFKENNSSENIYVETVYERYNELFIKINDEYNLCKDVNKASAKVNNEMQNIWKSEWPDVITGEKLHVLFTDVTIEQLLNEYQEAYNNRSNVVISTAELVEARNEIFDQDFRTILQNYDQIIGNQLNNLDPILVEYTKILMAYLQELVNETKNYPINYDDYPIYYENDSGTALNLGNQIIAQYNYIFADWDNNETIGQNICDIASSTQEIAEIFDSIRKLYQYYQTLCSNVKKYQIEETSKTLDAWNLILNEQKPDLLDHIYIIPNDSFNGLQMNNNVVGTAFVKEKVFNQETNEEELIKKEVAKVYIPIIMTLNTYELASLNGWDGTNIEINDDHILTPQIGAGVKDDTTNTFTGMVMGVVSNTSTTNNSSILNKAEKANKVGLIGYSNGKQSVFIDSKTGRASFGLPENDEQTSEGRIELVPGGVSKIGNWKIGNRFLYNIINGSYERRNDNDSRNDKDRIMIPHDKHGIILSSDKPYVHIKGETYADTNLNGINYEDEYNNINPGDSLELRMDPADKSLFSIVQHTSGFGDEDIEDLHFGYRDSGSDTVIVIKDYIANQNTGENVENNDGAEYYIYRLDTDENGYIPYYQQENLQEFYRVYPDDWLTTLDITMPMVQNSSDIYLKDSLIENQFKRTTSINGDTIGPVFSVDNDTGIITYNPNNLVWNNSNVGSSNGENWESITGITSSANSFNVDFKYTENMEPLTEDVLVGSLINGTSYNLYKIKIQNCVLHRELTGIELNNSINNYVQFYIVSQNDYNENITIDDALLKSEPISIQNNQDNIDIELFSCNNNYLVGSESDYIAIDNQYDLRMVVNIGSCITNANCSCTISSTSQNLYKVPPPPEYGTFKITSLPTGYNNWFNFTTSDGSIENISGTYCKLTNGKFAFKINGLKRYDFVIWRQGDSTINDGGITNIDKESYFFGNSSGWINEQFLDLSKTLSPAPSSEYPWYINFYPVGSYTIENIIYNEIDENYNTNQNTIGTETNTVVYVGYDQNGNILGNYSSTITGENDSVGNSIINEREITVRYKWINNNPIISMDYKKIYNIVFNWNNQINSNYNDSAKISRNIKLLDFNFTELFGFVPNQEALEKNRLCIVQKNENSISVQGIPYAKTYWNNGEQKVVFYKDYYEWVNRPNNGKNQYGYIDITENGNKYYKYIKTLMKKNINDLFENNIISNDYSHSIDKVNITSKDGTIQIYKWIELSVFESTLLKQALYWKEFIRVGLDENGRFFSAGLQDKKAYNRTGKIYGFGKVPNLYGQEIRIQQSSLNSYSPILKVFSNLSDMKTTYITQGKNDDGNISIRSAGETQNNYVELLASSSSSNETNTVPTGTSYIRVNSSNGIVIKTNKTVKIENNTDAYIDINNQNLRASCFLDYVISSNSSSSPHWSTSYEGDKEDSNDQGHYGIIGFIDTVTKNIDDNIINNKIPTIKLITGKNTEINIIPEKIQLKNEKTNINITSSLIEILAKSENSSIKIEGGSDSQSYFQVGKTKLLFNKGTDNKRHIGLINNSSTIYLYENNITINPYGKLIIYKDTDIQKNLNIQGDTVLQKSTTIGSFNGNLAIKNGEVDIYKNNNNYLKIFVNDLYQMFEWYQLKRWRIGIHGNTLYLRNVNSNSNPEGSYNNTSKTYVWNNALNISSSYKDRWNN